jgi:hypothetical protein
VTNSEDTATKLASEGTLERSEDAGTSLASSNGQPALNPQTLTAEMVMGMSTRERAAFILYAQRSLLTDMIQQGVDGLPAIVAVPLLQWLKHSKIKIGDETIKGVTPETIPDLLIMSIMKAPEEVVGEYWRVQKDLAEFLLWTPEKGAMPPMLTASDFISTFEPDDTATNGHSDTSSSSE